MTEDTWDRPRMSRRQVRALAQEITGELDGTAQFADDLKPPPVRRAGPEEWRLPDELDGHRLEKFTTSGRTWSRDSPEYLQLMHDVAMEPGDLTVYGAMSRGRDPYVVRLVFHVPLSDTVRAVEAMKRIFNFPDTRWQTISLGRKTVERGTSAEIGPMATMYLWADPSCLYQLVCPDPARAQRLLKSVTPFDQPPPEAGS